MFAKRNFREGRGTTKIYSHMNFAEIRLNFREGRGKAVFTHEITDGRADMSCICIVYGRGGRVSNQKTKADKNKCKP